MTRWEYRILDATALDMATSTAEFEIILNKLGAEGWEAFAIKGAFWLKRPLPDLEVEQK